MITLVNPIITFVSLKALINRDYRPSLSYSMTNSYLKNLFILDETSYYNLSPNMRPIDEIK